MSIHDFAGVLINHSNGRTSFLMAQINWTTEFCQARKVLPTASASFYKFVGCDPIHLLNWVSGWLHHYIYIIICIYIYNWIIYIELYIYAIIYIIIHIVICIIVYNCIYIYIMYMYVYICIHTYIYIYMKWIEIKVKYVVPPISRVLGAMATAARF